MARTRFRPNRIGASRDALGRQYRETLSVPAGTGITAGTGTLYETSIERIGDLVFTRIFIDLTGLNSSAAGDIIGVDGTSNPCHIGQVKVADCGTPVAIRMECLEAPATGINDIDLYAADEATGVEDAAISTLVETALVDSGAAWTSGRALGSTAVPAADQYLYLVGSGAGSSATYTAGKFLITLIGQA